jgi:hypothetical protein
VWGLVVDDVAGFVFRVVALGLISWTAVWQRKAGHPAVSCVAFTALSICLKKLKIILFVFDV